MNNQPIHLSRGRQFRVWAGWTLCVLPALALADAPLALSSKLIAAAPAQAGQPNTGVANPTPPAPQPPESQFTRPRMGAGNFGPVTAQDWDKVKQWMEENAPRRWAYFQSIRTTNSREADRDFREFVVPRIRQIKWLEQNDKPLYDLRMQRVHLEDQAFGMLQDLTASSSSDAKNKLTNSLKAELGEMYDNTLAERQLRIGELESFLQNEKKQLAEDQQSARKDKHVANTLKRVLETGTLDVSPRENNSRENGLRGLRGNPMIPPATQPAISD